MRKQTQPTTRRGPSEVLRLRVPLPLLGRVREIAIAERRGLAEMLRILLEDAVEARRG